MADGPADRNGPATSSAVVRALCVCASLIIEPEQS